MASAPLRIEPIKSGGLLWHRSSSRDAINVMGVAKWWESGGGNRPSSAVVHRLW